MFTKNWLPSKTHRCRSAEMYMHMHLYTNINTQHTAPYRNAHEEKLRRRKLRAIANPSDSKQHRQLRQGATETAYSSISTPLAVYKVGAINSVYMLYCLNVYRCTNNVARVSYGLMVYRWALRGY